MGMRWEAQAHGLTAGLSCCALLQVLFGPMVQLYPPGHPLDPDRRDGLNGPEFARAITIGDDVWVGGSAIIMGGRLVRGSDSLMANVIA